MTSQPQLGPILLLGATGKLGQALRTLWPNMPTGTPDLLPVSRRDSGDCVVWQPGQTSAPFPKVQAIVAPIAASVTAVVPAPATLELRYVDANRVNLRAGPSISDTVLDTITRGSAAEVLLLNDDGWAQIRLTDSGQTGWMATRLLSEG